MTPDRKKVLLFIDWYIPGFRAGGPVRSCFNLVELLKDRYDFNIVTRNADLGQTVPYEGIESDQWTEHPGGFRIMYISAGNLTINNIRKIITASKCDMIYLNSFFSFFFSLVPLWIMRFNKAGVPVILAPRGMIGQGALGIKPLKKKVFIFSAKMTGLYSGITFHATGNEEKKEIENIFGNKVHIRVARNLPGQKLLSPPLKEKKSNTAHFFFLSRISKKKNLLTVFSFLKKIPPRYIAHFDVIGPVDDAAYWKECQAAAKSLPENVKFRYAGEMVHEKIGEALAKYHFMILPTLHENYGHVILESMACGCPVIISDRTPFRNLTDANAGWDIPLENQNMFAEIIEKCIHMDQQEYSVLSSGAARYAEGIIHDPDIRKENMRLFSNL